MLQALFAATSTADLMNDAVVIWLVATVVAGIAAFAMRLPAVGLALLGSVIGVPLGVLLGGIDGLAGAGKDALRRRDGCFSGTGARRRDRLGGIDPHRSQPFPSSPSVVRRKCRGRRPRGDVDGLTRAGVLLERRQLHFPAVPVLVAADAAFLAVVLFAISVRPVDDAPARVDGEAAGGAWFLSQRSSPGASCCGRWSRVSCPSFGLPSSPCRRDGGIRPRPAEASAGDRTQPDDGHQRGRRGAVAVGMLVVVADHHGRAAMGGDLGGPRPRIPASRWIMSVTS